MGRRQRDRQAHSIGRPASGLLRHLDLGRPGHGCRGLSMVGGRRRNLRLRETSLGLDRQPRDRKADGIEVRHPPGLGRDQRRAHRRWRLRRQRHAFRRGYRLPVPEADHGVGHCQRRRQTRRFRWQERRRLRGVGLDRQRNHRRGCFERKGQRRHQTGGRLCLRAPIPAAGSGTVGDLARYCRQRISADQRQPEWQRVAAHHSRDDRRRTGCLRVQPGWRLPATHAGDSRRHVPGRGHHDVGHDQCRGSDHPAEPPERSPWPEHQRPSARHDALLQHVD